MIKKGEIGLDWSGAGLTGDQIIRNGARFALRYSAGVGNSSPNSAFKLCKPGEIAQIIASGADFIANSEWYESRITEGAAAGHADGLADLGFWKSRGLAKGARIYVSWDEYPHVAKYDAVQAYLVAYRQAQGGYYNLQLPGLYAGSAAIREMKRRGAAGKGWQMMSTSFSDNGLPYQPSKTQIAAVVAHPPAGIDLWQTGNYWFNKGADEDVALTADLGSHLQALSGTTEGASSMALTLADLKAIFNTDGILAPPADVLKANPTNKFWTFNSHIQSLAANVRAIWKVVATIPESLAELQKSQAALDAKLTAVDSKVDALQAGRVTVEPVNIPATLHIGAEQ